MIELFASLFDWLKAHYGSLSLFLLGMAVGCWLSALMVRLDQRRRDQ
jgi:hypothetical protein